MTVELFRADQSTHAAATTPPEGSQLLSTLDTQSSLTHATAVPFFKKHKSYLKKKKKKLPAGGDFCRNKAAEMKPEKEQRLVKMLFFFFLTESLDETSR